METQVKLNQPSQAQKSVLNLKNVHYRVPTEEKELSILNGCELSVYQGERLAIIGRSGSGKSTLLALMAGLELATEGEIALFEQSLSELSDDQRAKLRAEQVGFIFQDFQLMPTMSALENVLMPLELFQVSDAKKLATQALEKVGLTNRLQHLPSQLSGGEQQRVAIARAFVTKPKILFADEPTGNLDETTANQVQQLLFELNEEVGTTLIIVTHDLEFAEKCQRKVQLQQGRLIA
jgi:putative ABC transport system ATP-binding protein